MAKATKTKKGNLSISSENIFPVIKKWLYSDHDIFIRELISNGCDAITKLKKLSMMGEAELGDDEAFKVSVIVNPTEKTIRVIDNGIGMDEEEIEKYINQIAFSGAVDFLNQYKDKAGEDQIIGHFGLGFYSSFMVADKVTIESLSYKEGAKAVGWESDDGMTYKMAPIEKEGRGTIITLYLNEDSVEFANEGRVREVIEKYCSFMPIEIYLTDETKEPEYEEVPDEDDADVVEVTDAKDGEANAEADASKADAEEKPKKTKKVLKAPEPINDVTPLWAKHPNECTDDEYKDFYHKVFMDFKEPLF